MDYLTRAMVARVAGVNFHNLIPAGEPEPAGHARRHDALARDLHAKPEW